MNVFSKNKGEMVKAVFSQYFVLIYVVLVYYFIEVQTSTFLQILCWAWPNTQNNQKFVKIYYFSRFLKLSIYSSNFGQIANLSKSVICLSMTK